MGSMDKTNPVTLHDMRLINHKSDFDFILRLKDCKDPEKTVPFPECDFDVRFWTSCKANAYTASCKGGVCVNCRREADGIRFIFDNHRLGVGQLKWEPHFELPDGLYPDGVRDLYSPGPLDIQLVSGAGDCGDRAEVERLIRARYSVSQELAILRQRDTKPDEFAEYDAFAEECKAKAKHILSTRKNERF